MVFLMSRSYKKHPCCTDYTDGRTIPKRRANKVIRRYKNKIANGNAYKHLYCSWNIHDYISRWSWKQAKEEYNNPIYTWKNEYHTLEEFYKFWTKYYKRK